MGIIGRLFGGGKKQDGPASAGDAGKFTPREGIPMGFNNDEPVLTVTELAQEKIRNVLEAQAPPVEAIRVSSPFRGKYAMNIDPDANPGRDDTVLPFGGFQVFIDADSLPLVQGA